MKCPICGKRLSENIIEHCHNEHPKKKHKWEYIFNEIDEEKRTNYEY